MKQFLQNLLSPLRAVIRRWLGAKFITLTSQDGKPGLQITDLEHIAAVAVDLNRAYTQASGREKARLLVLYIADNYTGKIPIWVFERVAEIAYDHAVLSGLITKKA